MSWWRVPDAKDALTLAAMDHYSILDQTSPLPARPSPEPPPETNHYGLRFSGEEGGISLADMAQRDLDAALQLLTFRAQYITGASGAAIALRRKNRNDMLCRASAGSNAPELGAVLSAESGLSGESVRTRLPLRCDDAEHDPRVNREGCRKLGVASVVVSPILSDNQVLGVFELFSGKVNAFGERDLSALQRLGEMVETAMKLAETTVSLPGEILTEIPAVPVLPDLARSFDAEVEEVPAAAARSSNEAAPQSTSATTAAQELSPPDAAPALPSKIEPSKKPLFWTSALQVNAEAQKSTHADESHVPPVLRNLHKCWACGFPVSEGRKLCVECEEKQWRGQLQAPAPKLTARLPGASMAQFTAQAPASPTVHGKSSKADSRVSVFSAGSPPKQSWLSSKYIVAALLVVLLVVAAVAFLR